MTLSTSRRRGRSPRRYDSAETKTRILDAAEALFIEQGFVATSMRAITSHAGVNLAAAHYHFGSKEGLLGAAFHRRVAPLNAARLEALDILEARDDQPSVRDLMRAMLEPIVAVDPDSPLPRLAGRLFGEPESLARPLVEQEFGEVMGRFFDPLCQALPELDPETVRWRFFFVIGSMIHLLSFEKPLRPLDSGVDPNDGLAHLIDFAVNGLDPSSSEDRTPSPTRRA